MTLVWALLLLLNLFLYASSRLMMYIRVVALQGLLLGILGIYQHAGELAWSVLAVALLSTVIKAFLLPWFLASTVQKTGIRREIVPLVGFGLSTVIGVAFLALALVIAGHLDAVAGEEAVQLLVVAFHTLLTGLFLCVARAQISSQAIGYLVMENGVFVAGMAFAGRSSVVAELGVLLDISVAVFIMVAVIHHVRREFAGLDAANLTELRD